MTPAYQLAYTDRAKQHIAGLDGSVKKQLNRILEAKIAVHPVQFGEPLSGDLKSYRSHHFASHRVIYRIYEDLGLVVICAVGSRREGHKTEVYAEFESMVRAGRTAEQVLKALGVTRPKR